MMLIFALLVVATLQYVTDGETPACDEIEIVTKEGWRARPAVRERTMVLPVNDIIIGHTATEYCKNKMDCIRQVQFIQDFHLDERGWWDIAYNFLVGGDGRVYEARGWQRTGAHSINFNTDSVGISFIGNYEKLKPTEAQLNATLKLIECGVQKGYLTPSREIHGHRDVSCTQSPGKYVYSIIRYWANYKGGRLPLYHCRPLEKPVILKDVSSDD